MTRRGDWPEILIRHAGLLLSFTFRSPFSVF